MCKAAAGVCDADVRELAVWEPSRDAMPEMGPDAESFNFHPLPSGAYCVSRTTSAGWQHDGGQRVHSHCLIVPPAPRAVREAVAALREWGLVDAYRLHHPEPGKYSWWDYRAGNFHKGLGMRIDHLYVTRSVADRCTSAEIDRDARKGHLPSDHAPVYIALAD